MVSTAIESIYSSISRMSIPWSSIKIVSPKALSSLCLFPCRDFVCTAGCKRRRCRFVTVGWSSLWTSLYCQLWDLWLRFNNSDDKARLIREWDWYRTNKVWLSALQVGKEVVDRANMLSVWNMTFILKSLQVCVWIFSLFFALNHFWWTEPASVASIPSLTKEVMEELVNNVSYLLGTLKLCTNQPSSVGGSSLTFTALCLDSPWSTTTEE
jgi:hypothetical protein